MQAMSMSGALSSFAMMQSKMVALRPPLNQITFQAQAVHFPAAGFRTTRFGPSAQPSSSQHASNVVSPLHATSVSAPAKSAPSQNGTRAASSAPAGGRKPLPLGPAPPITGPALLELLERFKRLQNGSDIRGVALDGVEDQPVTLTATIAFYLGHAFARWLVEKGKTAPAVAVGRDPRLSGPLLETALLAGLLAGGASAAHTFGIATTPAMFYSIVQTGTYQGAIMITASHMPFHNNGFKFFTADGGLEKGDISELVQRAAATCAEAGVALGDPVQEQAAVLAATLRLDPAKLASVSFLPTYAASLRDIIKKGVNHKEAYHFPLQGLRFVVDAGNGSGGFFATQVLAPLGADVSGSQFLDPDGTFPNHIPNPENAEAMAAGSRAVLAAKADLGIVFDTDVDRSAIVDRSGREINSNKYIALQAAVVLREHPGTTIVTDSVTSNGLTEFITKLGGKHFRYKRGYKNVIGKGMSLAKEGVDCQLMMETSGHGAVKENYYLDDGAYLAVKAVIEFVRRRLAGEGDISELLRELKEPLEAKEFRIKIQDPNFKIIGAQALSSFHDLVSSGNYPNWTLEEVNHEGWRVNVDEGEGKRGWLLLRQSLHDPLLVLNIESEVAGGVKVTGKRVLDFLSSASKLDMSALAKGVAAA